MVLSRCHEALDKRKPTWRRRDEIDMTLIYDWQVWLATRERVLWAKVNVVQAFFTFVVGEYIGRHWNNNEKSHPPKVVQLILSSFVFDEEVLQNFPTLDIGPIGEFNHWDRRECAVRNPGDWKKCFMARNALKSRMNMENKWKRNARCRVCDVIFQVWSLFSKGCEEYMSSIGPAAFLGSAVRCSVSFCFCFSFETEDSQGNSPDLGWPKRTAMPLARHISGRLPGGFAVLWWPILYLNVSDSIRNAEIGTYSVWQSFFQ